MVDNRQMVGCADLRGARQQIEVFVDNGRVVVVFPDEAGVRLTARQVQEWREALRDVVLAAEYAELDASPQARCAAGTWWGGFVDLARGLRDEVAGVIRAGDLVGEGLVSMTPGLVLVVIFLSLLVAGAWFVGDLLRRYDRPMSSSRRARE